MILCAHYSERIYALDGNRIFRWQNDIHHTIDNP